MNYFPKMIVPVLLLLLESSAAAGSLELSGGDELVKWAGYGEEKLSTVVISGRILCHAAHTENRPSSDPHPVSGARVGVVCGTNRKTRRLSSAKGITDGSGNFEIDLPSSLHAIPNLDKVCHVRVVTLPRTSPCRQACAAKHNKPIALSSTNQGIRTYTTQNINLSPA